MLENREKKVSLTAEEKLNTQMLQLAGFVKKVDLRITFRVIFPEHTGVRKVSRLKCG